MKKKKYANKPFRGIVKLPNFISSVMMVLTEAEAEVFIYTLSLAQYQKKLRITVKLETIEKRCGIDDAERVIAGLKAKHFLRKENRVIAGKYASSILALDAAFEEYLDLQNNYFFFPVSSLAKLGGTSAKLLVFLTFLANMNNGECFPSLSAICRRTGLARSTTIRNLKRLEELGFIVKKHYMSAEHPQLHLHNRYYVKSCAKRAIGNKGWNSLQKLLSSAGTSISKYVCAAIKNILAQGTAFAQNNIARLYRSIEKPRSFVNKAQCAVRALKAKAISFISSFTDKAYKAAQELNSKLCLTFATANKKAVAQLNSNDYGGIFFLKYGVVSN